ncbi:uncharacterized protein CDAR_276571 [Caerostris darwini]|uniref:Uncharacterized protein n=1 Tax=Caerostris darwini TaxID=1538125 RepID=A0AAV4N006_9ARAC|nr:uncharacterized protein CDAR_276571 [Caerostris darwini]
MIVASQNTYIAQLEGRIQKMEKNLAAKASTEQALLTEAVARELEKSKVNNTDKQNEKIPAKVQMDTHTAKPSFASVAKTATINKKTTASKSKQQLVATIKPIDEKNTSLQTKAFIQINVDITRTKIAVKRVSPINQGGIIIETTTDQDLNKLLHELENNPSIKDQFKMRKPVKRNPQFICFGVSEEVMVKKSLQIICDNIEDCGNIKIVHSYKSQRGRSWIFEASTNAYKLLQEKRKVNIGWERVSIREYLRVGHLLKLRQFRAQMARLEK